ncbi:hypothetical protein [Rhodoplanes roseus]|nr:hypothetical protein [Rhodoplanes roseus]
MRALLLLLTACAALALIAGAALAALLLAGVSSPGLDTATLVVRLAVFPVLLALLIVHEMRRRRTTAGTREDWSRTMAAAPTWLRLLRHALFVWVAIDFLRMLAGPFIGRPVAPGETWSIWLFLWTACLTLAVVALLRTPATPRVTDPG